MAATDLADLHRFEEHIEAAAVTFLNSATGVNVYRSNEMTDLTTPRIEVEIDIGDAYQPAAPRNGGASPDLFDWLAFNSSFAINIITDNTVGQSSSMVTYVGEVREAMMRSGANWNTTTLPYYDVKELQPTNSTMMSDGDFNETSLTYLVVFEIRRDAWPA